MRTATRPTRVVPVLAFVITATACSGGGSGTSSPTTTLSATGSTSVAPPTTPVASSSTAVPTTTTTVPVADTSSAVWPTAASGVRYRDPVAAARGFATDFLHMVGVITGPFAPGDARSGEVAVRASARGPVTTVLVRQLANDGTWWVLASATPGIRPSSPVALATIASPVRLRGVSTAFEATVNVSIRQDDRSTPLAESFVMGGGNGDFGPYDAALRFAPPTARLGAVVLYTLSSEDGHTSAASVVRVRFAPA